MIGAIAYTLSFFGLPATATPFRAKASTNAQPVWLVEADPLSPEEKLALYSIQGLANRENPRVFIKLGAGNRWMDFQFHVATKNGGPVWNPETVGAVEKKYAYILDYWVDYFSTKNQFSFKPATLPELIRALGPELKGSILYDEIKTDLCAVGTLAGLDDAVPLTAGLEAKLAGQGAKVPVVFDYRAVRAAFPKSADLRLEAHRWAIDNLLPRCRKDGAVSRDRTYGSDLHDSITDIDLAVKNRWIVYDLSHAAAENKPDGPVKPNPAEQALLEMLLAQITPFSPVYGWGRPEEQNFIRSLNRHRLLGVCSSVPNNSFFASLPAPTAPFKQAGGHCDEAKLVVEPKVYVAFMVNEGDTLKIANGLMGDGAWLQPERGMVPINWGIDPLLNRHFPALMAYYYATMTTNDYFFAAASGWGYTHPSFLPSDALLPYGALIKQGGALADVRYVDIWNVNALRQNSSFNPFLQATGLKGLTDWDGSQQKIEYTDYGMTIIKGNQYYTLDDPAKFAAMLVNDMNEVKPPWFIIVYGATGHGTPYKFSEVAKRLPTEKFKVVKLDEFFTAAKKAEVQMKGRVWKPGPNAPKGVAP